jgi:hypothetical protein
MDNIMQLNDAILWDYVDGFLEPSSMEAVENSLQNAPYWQDRLAQIREEKKAYSKVPLEKPALGFTDRVMAAWAVEYIALAAPKPKHDRKIQGILIGFGFILFLPLVMMLAYVFRMSESFTIQLDTSAWTDLNWAALFDNAGVQCLLYIGFTVLALNLLEKYLNQRGVLAKIGISHGKK